MPRRSSDGKTILISGGTGTGKTTLLNILGQSIPDHERIVVIEDTAELRIEKPNILPVECQTDTYRKPVTFDDLLKAALRWRPDRIILGEVRGIEARTLLDSFNTGHAGSLATIHANSAAKALRRFANLVLRSHSQATFEDIEAEIGEAVDFVVHVEREPGRRVIREVLRLNGYNRSTQSFKRSTSTKLEAGRLRRSSHAESHCAKPPQSCNECTDYSSGIRVAMDTHNRATWRRLSDTLAARQWLAEGVPIADVLTMLEVRRRFEFSPHCCPRLCSRDSLGCTDARSHHQPTTRSLTERSLHNAVA